MAVPQPAMTALTLEQLAAWDEDGFLLLPAVISPAEVAAAAVEVSRLQDLFGSPEERDSFNRTNIIEDSEVLFDLIDNPALLGAAASLMGAAIQLLLSAVTCRPASNSPAIRWHTDDPSPYFFPRTAGVCPVWQLKCCIYLTDLARTDMANFIAAPGSHRVGVPRPLPGREGVLEKDAYHEDIDITSAIPGARQILASAGDALIFHPALWHSVAPNRSASVRKNVWLVYGPIWMRLGDRIASTPEFVSASPPHRQQLLGATTSYRSALAPHDEGVPLVRVWEGMGYEAVWRRNRDELLSQWWRDSSDGGQV